MNELSHVASADGHDLRPASSGQGRIEEDVRGRSDVDATCRGHHAGTQGVDTEVIRVCRHRPRIITAAISSCLLAFAGALLMFPGSASAQLAEALQVCAKDPNPTARAACYEAVKASQKIDLAAERKTTLANVRTISGSDPMDDSTYTGIEINSSDSRAVIYLVCGRGGTQPTITFAHKKLLQTQRIGIYNTFVLTYRIDKKGKKSRWFIPWGDRTSGYLSGLLKRVYDSEFGKVPDEEREARILREFITDFVRGKSALVRVNDYGGRSDTYRFGLIGIEGHLDTISDCYSPP